MATSPVVKLLVVLIALFGASCIKVQCFDFSFSDFQEENRKDLSLSENSTIFRDALQITPDLNGDITNTPGRAYYGKKFRLWSKKKGIASFNTTFVINISNKDSPDVGEGLAFVLSADSAVPEDSYGQWLGIVNASTNGTSQAGIVGVEFDTRKSYEEEPDNNHVGLDINSCYSIEQKSLSSYGINISIGDDVRVVVQYDGKNMTVFVSKGNETENLTSPVFSVPLDLSAYLPESVHVGFSASTGNFTQLNCIRAWEFHGVDVGENSNLLWVWIAIPVLALALISGLAFYMYWRWKSKKDDLEGAYPNIEDHIKSSTAPRRFRLRELKRATGNFNRKNKLGKGGFGTVYKGVWKEKEIAVKRVSKKSQQGNQEFIAEVTTIGNLNYKNLVKLIGWCYENRELLLVYEYMPNGSLDKFIFYDEKAGKEESSQPTLSWETRLNIIQGVAEALEYLHNGCEKRVLHRDVKSSNIMLDSQFNARLGDFGLARTIQQREKTHHSTIEIAGTPGYMAPETFLISRATVETDVYSYGVLLLEVVCGRKPGNQSELNNYNNSIVNWLWEYYRKGRITDAADSDLDGDFVEKEVESALILGLACCHPNPHYRPSMKTVLAVLTGEADPPLVPQERPSFVWPAMPPVFSQSDYSLTGSQFSTVSEISGR
ncbi:hypothetical protein CRYUN_Cryun05aG0200500 [Craigia yunnanensis]